MSGNPIFKISSLLCVHILLWNTSQAQFKVRLNIGSSSAYEYNVFNANPSRQRLQNGQVVNPLQSGYFQRMEGQFQLSKKGQYQTLALDVSAQYDYFPNLEVANVLRPNLKLNYRLHPSKNHRFSVTARRMEYRTNRPEDDTEVLRPPRSYTRTQVNTKYQWKLGNRNTSYVDISWRQQEYDTPENRTFFYHAWSGLISSEQVLYKSKQHKHKLQMKASYSQRRYWDEELDDEDLVEEEERDWRYMEASLAYSWRHKKGLNIRLGMEWNQRQDLIQDRFGYQQFESNLQIGVRKKKVEWTMKASFAERRYQTLTINSTSNDLLIHYYVRTGMEVKWKIKKKTALYIGVRGIHRRRNSNENARIFLDYDNVITRLGIKQTLF